MYQFNQTKVDGKFSQILCRKQGTRKYSVFVFSNLYKMKVSKIRPITFRASTTVKNAKVAVTSLIFNLRNKKWHWPFWWRSYTLLCGKIYEKEKPSLSRSILSAIQKQLHSNLHQKSQCFRTCVLNPLSSPCLRSL